MAYTRKSGWMVPNRRAEGYVQERKSGKHGFKYKNGQALTEQEKAFRSGYLFCQRDHAEAHKYFEAHPEKAEAARKRREAKKAAEAKARAERQAAAEEAARQEAYAHMAAAQAAQDTTPAKKPSKRKS